MKPKARFHAALFTHCSALSWELLERKHPSNAVLLLFLKIYWINLVTLCLPMFPLLFIQKCLNTRNTVKTLLYFLVKIWATFVGARNTCIIQNLVWFKKLNPVLIENALNTSRYNIKMALYLWLELEYVWLWRFLKL